MIISNILQEMVAKELRKQAEEAQLRRKAELEAAEAERLQLKLQQEKEDGALRVLQANTICQLRYGDGKPRIMVQIMICYIYKAHYYNFVQ